MRKSEFYQIGKNSIKIVMILMLSVIGIGTANSQNGCTNVNLGCQEIDPIPCGENSSCDALICNGDFENYFPLAHYYYCQAGLPCWIGDDPYLSGSIDNVISDIDGNIFLGMAVNPQSGNAETFYAPLVSPVPSGCSISVCFDAAVQFPSQGLRVFGANGVPCNSNSFDGQCTMNIPTFDPDCAGFSYFCIQDIPAGTIQTGAMITGIGQIPQGVTARTNFDQPLTQICFDWENNTGLAMDFLFIAPTFDPMQEIGYAFLDNISASSCISADFTYEVSNDCLTVSFETFDTDPNTVHHWDFGDGSTSTDANPVHTYATSGVYVVRHTVIGPCGSAEHVEIVEVGCNSICNCSSGGYAVGTGSSITIGETNLPTNGELENDCISVAGELIIDESYVFKNVHFIMEPGAKITITGDDVLVVMEEGCLLEGCIEMWQGIHITEDAEFDFRDNVIRDAEHAIMPEGQTRLRVQGNSFVNNYIGIYTSELNGGATRFIKRFNDDEPEEFFGNSFTAPGPLLAPRELDFSYAGIELNNVVDFNIGDDDFAQNVFHDSEYGIIYKRSTRSKIDNNQISDLNGDRVAIDVYAWAINTQIKRNVIFNVDLGVYAHANSSFEAYSNDINAPQGIMAYYCYDLDISRNDITSTRNGIHIYGLSDIAGELDFKINQNELRMEDTGKGISISNSNAQGEIIDNEIQLLDEMAGEALIAIEIGICVGPFNIQANKIAKHDLLPGLPAENPAMLIVGSEFIHVVDNEINMEEIDSDFNINGQFLTGISLGLAPGYNLCCNQIDASSYGIHFQGDCVGSSGQGSNFSTNIFGKHSRSALFVFQGMIAPQYDKGNEWNTANEEQGRHVGPSILLPENFIRTAGADFSGTVNNNIVVTDGEPSDWFALNGSPNSCLISGNNFCGELFPAEGPPPSEGSTFTPVDLEFIKSYGVSAIDRQGFHFNGQSSLFEEIQHAKQNLSSYPIEIQNFYNDNKDENLGWYSELKNLSKELFTLSENYITAVTEVKNLNLSFDQFMYEWEAMSTFQKEEAETALQAKIQELNVGYQNVYWAEVNHKYSKGLDLEKMANIVNGLEVNSIVDDNLKAIYNLFISSSRSPLQTFNETQKGIIASVANQCLADGGPAVVLARILSNTYGSFLYDDINDLCNELEREERKAAQVDEKKEGDFILMPNPAKSELHINYNNELESNIQVNIINMAGALKETRSFDGAVKIDVSTYANGIYFCEFLVNGQKLATKKFIKLN